MTLLMIPANGEVFVKLRIFAAALTPPKFDEPLDEVEENCFFMMFSSSSIADGGTVSSVATRSTISGRASAGRKFSTSAATSESRTERIIATTCGCSERIMSAIERASIQRRISSPLLEFPGRIRPKTEAALSSPSARFSTVST